MWERARQLLHMNWLPPRFTKAEVDKAGMALVADNVARADLEIIDNWRSAHHLPLNTLRAGLRKRAEAIDDNCIIAQRIKRLSSITFKLKHSPTLRLSQMQDIGGCRAVLSGVTNVNDLFMNYKNSDTGHKLHSERDYIKHPKPDGYRGVHLVYKYAGRKPEYHGLRIEIQLRTRNQHAWATAVETVDLFTRQALKSNKGRREWLRFFALMGNAIAYKERSSPVPNTPSFEEGLSDVLIDYCERLDIENRLLTFGKALQELPHYQVPGDRYFLLVLDPSSKELEVRGYSAKQLEKAFHECSTMERFAKGSGKNVVLVSVSSTSDLRNAYPNYYLDTRMFLDLVDWAIK